MTAGVVINGLADALAVVVKIRESAQREIVFLAPPSVLSVGGASFSSTQSAQRFIQNGGVLRGITTISLANLEEARMRLDIGEDLRHSNPHYEIFMIVGDKQQSLSSINIGIPEYTLDTPVSAFWSDDPAYAEYLLTSFESVWSHAVPAARRIRELELEQPNP